MSQLRLLRVFCHVWIACRIVCSYTYLLQFEFGVIFFCSPEKMPYLCSVKKEKTPNDKTLFDMLKFFTLLKGQQIHYII